LTAHLPYPIRPIPLHGSAEPVQAAASAAAASTERRVSGPRGPGLLGL